LVAQAHAHDLATHPKFFAESGLVEMIISPADDDTNSRHRANFRKLAIG